MSVSEYGVAGLLALLATGPLALAAWMARARWLPGWRGSPARLAEAVLWLGGVTLVLQALGVVGLLNRGSAVAGCAVTGLVLARLLHHRSPGAADPPPAPIGRRGIEAVGLVVAGGVVAQWTARSLAALDHGMPNIDTLWYHMPLAGWFAQGNALTDLLFTHPDAHTSFYPSNSELLHGFGILLTRHDVLSPVMNLGWLGLGLLAAWCFGRPYGAAGLTLLGSCLVFESFAFVGTQPGDAGNDIGATALVLASAALLVNGGDRRPALAVAGLAGGLAAGTKLTALLTVGLLTVFVIARAARGARRAVAGVWLGPVLLGGGLWYGRNLVTTGNPLPWLSGGPLGLPDPGRPNVPAYRGTMADHLLDLRTWDDFYAPALEAGFGPAWFLLLGGVFAVGVAMAVRSRDVLLRGLSAVAAIGMAGFVVTPTGHPGLFFSNLRFLGPALALGIVVLALWKPLAGGRGPAILAGVFTAVFLSYHFKDAMHPPTHLRGALIVGMLFATAGVAGSGGALRRLGPAARGCLIAALALLSVGAGWRLQRFYLDQRYANWAASPLSRDAPWGTPLSRAYAWARSVNGRRIAVGGTVLQWPLWGQRPTNAVRFVGRRRAAGDFEIARDCAQWRSLLAKGRYEFVVTGPEHPTGQAREPREAAWTRTDPSARVLLSDPAGTTVFRLVGRPDPRHCR